MDKFEQQNANDINVATVAIDFSPLYSVLQHNYEGHDISNIIMQLLHVYQPEDDITAYECVLRKIQSLLEGCDTCKEQLLLSMIPTPKNVSDRTIKEVFRTATGFTKLSPRENDTMSSSIFSLKDTNGIKDNDTSSTTHNFLCDMDRSNFKPSPSEEIPVDVSPNFPLYINRQINSLGFRLTNNLKSQLDKNNKYQISSCQQDLFNKKYYAPTKINSTNKSHLSYSSQTIYEDMRMYNNNNIIADLCQDKISRQFNDIKYESKKCNNIFDEDKKSNVLETAIDIDQNSTLEQSIKDNMYRMDVCWDEDQNIRINADDLSVTVRHSLKISLNNFLKRAQEGTYIELSEFPQIRPYPQKDSLSLVHSISKDREPVTLYKVLGKDSTSSFASNVSKNCLPLKEQNSMEKDCNALDEKKKKISYVTGSQMKCKTREQDKTIKAQLSLSQNNLDYAMEKKTIISDTKEPIYKCKIRPRSNNANLEKDFQIHSMSELAAFKKQYYDTLLSVRRAKVAVTNSLAFSSNQLTGYDDSYCSNYVHEHQHLFQQQRHFAMRPQFSICPTVLSGLSSVHSNQYSWAKSDHKYLLLKQLRLQQQTSPLFARSQGNWTHQYIGSLYSYPFIPNGNGHTKHCMRHKSLEDIIGKLKNERDNVNN